MTEIFVRLNMNSLYSLPNLSVVVSFENCVPVICTVDKGLFSPFLLFSVKSQDILIILEENSKIVPPWEAQEIP